MSVDQSWQQGGPRSIDGWEMGESREAAADSSNDAVLHCNLCVVVDPFTIEHTRA